MTTKRTAILTISALTGAVLIFVFNFFILDKMLIPDPCYYHSHDTNAVFDIFYERTSSDGYHPYPTKFNFIFTLTIGAIFGFLIAFYKSKKHNEK